MRKTGAAAAKRTSPSGAALRGGRPPQPGEGRLNHQRESLPTRVDELPGVPAAYVAALDPVIAALATLGVDVGGQARASIDDHVRLLLAWNAAINLTAITEPGAIARLHVADSLGAVPVIRSGPHATLLDLGSGGGFPGIPMAAVLTSSRVTLVDSIGKKAAFLEAAALATGLADRITVASVRAETLAPGHWDVILARAVGALADLVELALPLLAPGGRLVAWKRGELGAELAGAGRAARAIGGSAPTWHPHPDELVGAAGLAGHGVVVVRKVGASPPGYPRDRAARIRQPW